MIGNNETETVKSFSSTKINIDDKDTGISNNIIDIEGIFDNLESEFKKEEEQEKENKVQKEGKGEQKEETLQNTEFNLNYSQIFCNHSDNQENKKNNFLSKSNVEEILNKSNFDNTLNMSNMVNNFNLNIDSNQEIIYNNFNFNLINLPSTPNLQQKKQENDGITQFSYTPLGKVMPKRTYNFKEVKKSSQKNIELNELNTKKNLSLFFKNQKNTRENNKPIGLALEETLNKYGHFTMDIYENYKTCFLYLLKFQQTSRICQIYLEGTPLQVIIYIFNEISNNLVDLLCDIYANYFCLKLFYLLNENGRKLFLNIIIPFLPKLSKNKVSTYPIQCIIEQTNDYQERDKIFKSLCNDFMSLSLDVYGTHILEKILTNFNYEIVEPLIIFVIKNFNLFTKNPNGLCLVKILIVSEYKKKYFLYIKNILQVNALDYIQNPYGNYALQTMLDNWDKKYCEDIISSFIGKCTTLSTRKFSANVIEKSVKKSFKFLVYFTNEMTVDNNIFIVMTNFVGSLILKSIIKICLNNMKNLAYRNICLIIIKMIAMNINSIQDKKVVKNWTKVLKKL